jgi:flagellar hook assembly protein FlgD
VLRKLVIASLLALVLAGPAAAQRATKTTLMPGVTYANEVQFTPRGPISIHTITAPRPGGLYALRPVLSNSMILGREKLTAIEKKASAGATVAGVNGDRFSAGGEPSGILIRGGVLDSPPLASRSSVGIAADGTLKIDRVAYDGIWRGNGQRRPLRLNQVPGANGVSLFTPAWGPTTPQIAGVTEAVLPSLPATTAGVELPAQVAQIGPTNGGTAIPPGGAVIMARGTGGAKLVAEAPVGTPVTVRLTLTPSWSDVTDAIGGGPLLVKGGKPIFRANELFSIDLLVPRSARTAVGQLADGRVVLVVVDGGRLGYSVGMTNFELALTMVRLGCVTASALDSGSSSAMAFDGSLLDQPSAPGGEAAIADALLVAYYGAYVPPPTEDVLSPNGDGVDETQTLRYKVVRPSQVSATLTGPGGVTIPLDSGVRQPKTYRFDWTGKNADGTLMPEGAWRVAVTATDDLGRTSAADRSFSLNTTLGFLDVPPTAVARRSGSNLTASFTLAHPAQVQVTLERASGAVVRTLLQANLQAGPATVRWDGRDANRVRASTGRYRLRVSATNELGTVDLSRSVAIRRG